MLIEEILYNHVNTTLEVIPKPIFEALRRIKESYDENVRTLKTLVIPNKKAPEGANSNHGASNGIRFEPYCVELMHLCLHDDETIEQIRKFLNCNNFSDISYI